MKLNMFTDRSVAEALDEMWLSKNEDLIMRRILSVLLENESGALSRVVGAVLPARL